MKKTTLPFLLLTGTLFLTGCASFGSSESASETEAAPVRDYVHGEDGYYNLTDEMPEFNMMGQNGGTCWLHAGAASMESAYFKQTGSYISIYPTDLLKIIYSDEADEGFFLQKGFDKYEFGGDQAFVMATLSRGFDGLTLDSSVRLDSSDRDAIKETLRNRGAVVIEIRSGDRDKEGFFGSYFTLNNPDAAFYDHDVVIVGWDDRFPKDYFKEPAAEDGAWIVYNSSYSSRYFQYISYCSSIGYAYSHSVTDRYSEVLSYDAGYEPDRCIRTGDSTQTANVFHEKGKLAAVGTYCADKQQNIRIEIYDSSFTELLYAQDALLDYSGYHTVELTEPVDVNDFAVVIKYEGEAPVEGESIDYGEINYVTCSEPGQSYVYLDGWKDLTDDGIRSMLNIDFAPNNCCIKALFAKE